MARTVTAAEVDNAMQRFRTCPHPYSGHVIAVEPDGTKRIGWTTHHMVALQAEREAFRQKATVYGGRAVSKAEWERANKNIKGNIKSVAGVRFVAHEPQKPMPSHVQEWYDRLLQPLKNDEALARAVMASWAKARGYCVPMALLHAHYDNCTVVTGRLILGKSRAGDDDVEYDGDIWGVTAQDQYALHGGGFDDFPAVKKKVDALHAAYQLNAKLK